MNKNIVLAAIVLLALALRLVGLSFGLPNLYHQDEPIIVNHALSIAATGWNTGFFVIPPFIIYQLFIVCGIFYSFGKWLGFYHDPSDFALAFFNDPTAIYLLGRFCIGVFFGVATVWVVGRFGQKFFSKKVSLLAALLLAVLPLHVQHSHYIYADIPLTLVTTLLFFKCLEIYKNPCLTHYAIFGALIGWATSIKYTALYFVPVLLVVHLMVYSSKSFNLSAIGKLLLSGVSCVAIFFLVAPYSFLDWSGFIHQITKQTGAESYVGFFHHLFYSLGGGTGLLFMGFSYVGIFSLYKQEKYIALIASLFVGIFYFINTFFGQSFARYMIPLTPIFSILTAYGFLELVTKKIRARPALIFVFLLIILELFLPAAYNDYLFLKKDTRTHCLEWFERNVKTEARIALDNRSLGPRLLPSIVQIKEKYSLLGNSNQDKAKTKKIDYLLRVYENKTTYNVYQLKVERASEESNFLFLKPVIIADLESIEREEIEFIVINYSDFDPEIHQFLLSLGNRAKLLASFSPYFDPMARYSIDPHATTAAPHLAKDLFRRKSLGPYLEVYHVRA